MKIMSKTFLVIGLLLAGFAAKSEVLYWQVTGEEFSWANLKVTNGSTETTLASEVYPADLGANTGTYTTMQQTDISSYASSAYSFFVELVTYVDGGENTVQKGYTWNYNDLVSAGYVAGNGLADGAAASAAASLANLGSPTPEPTSGMLLLIGGSLLALRRRRRQA